MANDAQMPERIWLIPNAGNDGETVWCDNPAPGVGMEASDAVEYSRSDICASGQQVRALEWAKIAGAFEWRAECPFGVYEIAVFDVDLPDHDIFMVRLIDLAGDKSWHKNTSAAKAAAQADYERRILAALTPAHPPQPSVSVAEDDILADAEAAYCADPNKDSFARHCIRAALRALKGEAQ